MATQHLQGANTVAPVDYTYVERKGLPFFGTFVDFVRNPLKYVTHMRDRADWVDTIAMGRRMHVASHPDLIEQVLVTHSAHFRKDAGLRSLTGIFGNGLLTSDGDFWLRQRRMASPAYRGVWRCDGGADRTHVAKLAPGRYPGFA
jgi:cytochrome P450